MVVGHVMDKGQGAVEYDVDSWLVERGGEPGLPLKDNIRNLLMFSGACDASVFQQTASRWTRREVLPALTFVLRDKLAFSPVRNDSHHQYGLLLGSELRVPNDWHEAVAVVESGVHEIGEALYPRSHGDADWLEMGRARMSASSWVEAPSSSTIRSLIGMMKRDLMVSTPLRQAAFARWLLGLPIEDFESGVLKEWYKDDSMPGGALLRRSQLSEAPRGEFLGWLAEFNGGELRRSDSTLRVPLASDAFRSVLMDRAMGGVV